MGANNKVLVARQSGLDKLSKMQTLSTLFSKGRSELQTELDKATDLKQVVKLVQNRVDSLEKTYINELSVTQVRLVNFFLDTLRQSLSTLATANETRTQVEDLEPEPATTQGKYFDNQIILKLLQAIVSVCILVSLFSLARTEAGAWMPLLLVFVAIGLEVALQLGKSQPISQPVEVPKLPPVRVDTTALLDNLAEALNTIDIAVTSVEEANKPLAASGLEELTEILDLLQRLIGASFLDNPLMALQLAKLMPQILFKQGIRVQSYQPDDAQSLREYFEFEPSIDPSAKDYVTLTPALLKGERLLRRGRVIEPVDARVSSDREV